MRIALVCPYSFSYPGGVQQHVLALYREFKKRGIYVKILTPKSAKRPPPTRDIIFLGTSVRLPTNITSFHLNLSFPNRAFKIPEVLNKEKFDIIHFHEPGVPFLSWQLLEVSNATNIATFHSAFQGGFSLDFYRTLIGPFERFFLHRLDGTIAVSQASRDTWKEFLRKKKGVIIPNGVNFERFQPRKENVKSRIVKILFVGRLEPRKGIMDLLRAFKILIGKIPATLTIVGSGPSSYRAKFFVKTHHLEKRVNFVGQVSDRKLPSYYAQADICCFPAVGGESFGIVLLEAMAMGKPLVVYANAGYLGVLKDYPWKDGLVSVRDYEKLASSLETLVKDKDLRKKLGEWGLEEVKRYSWEKIAKEVMIYYEKILKKSGKI